MVQIQPRVWFRDSDKKGFYSDISGINSGIIFLIFHVVTTHGELGYH